MEDRISVDRFLQSIPLFAGLDAMAVSDLAFAAEPFSVPAEEVLFRQNDEGAGVHLIERGKVRVLARTLGDSAIELATLGPGSVLGELSLLDDGRRSAAARTTEPTRGWFISRTRFDALYRSARPAAFEVADRLRMEVARRTRSTIGEIATHPIAGDALLRAQASAGSIDERPAAGMAAMLRELRQFSSFSDAEAEALLSLCGRAEVRRGTSLANAGGEAGSLAIVVRGAVRTGLDRDGGIEQLSVHGPGDMIGLCPCSTRPVIRRASTSAKTLFCSSCRPRPSECCAANVRPPPSASSIWRGGR